MHFFKNINGLERSIIKISGQGQEAREGVATRREVENNKLKVKGEGFFKVSKIFNCHYKFLGYILKQEIKFYKFLSGKIL